ncbi:hypothetical protein [Salmonella enterica]|uniref:hypothetical protein n=1 Tax=Salmonella enterica TaxID=28901 RepID=UPI00398C48E1
MVMRILAPLVGVLGALLLAYGAWLLYPPAGFVVAGALCLFWSWRVARALARTQPAAGVCECCFFRDYF